MKILHIIQRYPPSIGGSETWCQGIARYLSNKGHIVKVLALDVYFEQEYWRRPPIDNCLLRFGKIEYDGKVKIIRCKRTKVHLVIFQIFKIIDRFFKVFLYGPHSIEMYFRMIKETREADIIHLHTIPYPHNLIGLFIAKLFRKKVAITPHFHIGHQNYERWSNLWLMKCCDMVFAVSDYEKEYIINKGIDKDNVFVAYNAIDLNDYQPKDLNNFKKSVFHQHDIQEDARIVIFIGRKIEYKGIDTLVEAVRRLRKEMPVKLFLVGPNFPWFKDYYSKLSEEEKKDIIDFGVVSHQDKVNLLHLSHVLVLPSKFEAFGIVFLEAWACGLPVIGTEQRPVSDILNGAGSTVKFADALSLKEKITWIFNNKNNSTVLAKNGLAKIDELYSLNKVGYIVETRYLNVLQDLSVEKEFEIIIKNDKGISSDRYIRFIQYNEWINRKELIEKKTRLSSRPLLLAIDLINKCNLKPHCIMCFIDWNRQSGMLENEEMGAGDLLEFGKFFDCAHTIQNCGVGEPLLARDFFKILKLIYMTRKKIGFNTNGLLLNKGTADRLLDYSSALQDVNFSIDAASEETYAKIRSRNLKEVIENIDYLSKEKKRRKLIHPRIGMVFIVMRVNKHEIRDFMKLAISLGVDLVDFVSLLDLPNSIGEIFIKRDSFHFNYKQQILSFDELKDVDFEIHEKAKMLGLKDRGINLYCKLFPKMVSSDIDFFLPKDFTGLGIKCIQPWRYLFPKQNGDTFGCSHMNISLGNWRREGLDAMWNSRRMIKIRKELAQGYLAEECFRYTSCPILRTNT